MNCIIVPNVGCILFLPITGILLIIDVYVLLTKIHGKAYLDEEG